MKVHFQVSKFILPTMEQISEKTQIHYQPSSQEPIKAMPSKQLALKMIGMKLNFKMDKRDM